MLSFSSSHFLSICDTPSPELNTGVGSVNQDVGPAFQV